VAERYESLKTMPDNLLLFFHHVPYDYVLHSGKTVIQHIYDSHYEGAAEAQTYPEKWERLHGLIDEERYQAVLRKLQYQAGHAIVWRDVVCNWFSRESNIRDKEGRVGNHPYRIEAESLRLNGYTVETITPWEDASGGNAIACPVSQCTATIHFEGKPGWYDVAIQYFDQNNGNSRFEIKAGTQQIGQWIANDNLPTKKPDAHSSTRRTFPAIALRTGDEIQITASPDGEEHAMIDYVEIRPAQPGNSL